MNCVVKTIIQACCRNGSLCSSLQISTVFTEGNMCFQCTGHWGCCWGQSSVVSRTCFLCHCTFYFLHDTDLWHCLLAAIMVAHASMKYSDAAWKSRFPRTCVLWWITLVVSCLQELNLPTKGEWTCRASGTAGAPLFVGDDKDEKVDGEKKERWTQPWQKVGGDEDIVLPRTGKVRNDWPSFLKYVYGPIHLPDDFPKGHVARCRFKTLAHERQCQERLKDKATTDEHRK